MPKAPINGIDLYYESHGDESAPTIIFAHGRGGNHMSWWQQVAAFSSDFRCITFDHRGWGDSIAEHGSPLRENFISDLIALLDYLKVDKAFLVAQSMGGFSCLGFALAHPERTLGLVLGDTTGGVATEGTLAALDGATPPPDGPARSLAASFIDENPAMPKENIRTDRLQRAHWLSTIQYAKLVCKDFNRIGEDGDTKISPYYST